MALKIRLTRKGRKNKSFFRLVATEDRSRRDGAYIENLGWYNPHEDKEGLDHLVISDRVLYWLKNGAQMTHAAESLIRRATPEVLKTFKNK